MSPWVLSVLSLHWVLSLLVSGSPGPHGPQDKPSLPSPQPVSWPLPDSLPPLSPHAPAPQ